MVTSVAVAVAADEITTVVPFVTLAMVAPAGIPAPVMNDPTSALVNAAVAEVTVVFVLVAPSATKRECLTVVPALGTSPVMFAPALELTTPMGVSFGEQR